MKRIPCFLLLSIFLASCTAIVPPSTSTITPVAAADSTSTPRPTRTTAPTNTPEPMSTPDPMKDAPEGTTSVSEDGITFYKALVDPTTGEAIIDPNTGEQMVVTWTEFKNVSGEALWDGWSVEKTQTDDVVGGIYLVDHDDISEEIMLRVFADQAIVEEIPIISHTNDTKEIQNDQKFSAPLIGNIVLRKFQVKSATDVPQEDLNAFSDDLSSDEGVSFTYVTSTGEHTVNMGHLNGFDLVMLPYSDPRIDPKLVSGAREVEDSKGLNLRIIIMEPNEEGNVMVLMGTEKPFNTYSANAQRKALLFAIANFFEQIDQTSPLFYRSVGVLADASGENDPLPYIELGK